MRIRGDKTGYVMNLSARETYDWAHTPGASWPCSELAGHAVRVEIDSNGLCDLAVRGAAGFDGGDELAACVGDFLPAEYRHLWPTWETVPATAAK